MEVRELIDELGWAVCAIFLVEDAARDGNDVAREVARSWIGK